MSANERLVTLLPAIESTTKHYVLTYNRYPHFDTPPSEVAQEAALAFLQRAADAPAFLDQPDEVIIARVSKDGWNAIRRAYRQGHRFVPLGGTDRDGEAYEPAYASDKPGPEETTLILEAKEHFDEILRNLKPKYRAVAEGIMEGKPKGEIMRELGATPQTFTYYRRQLAHAFMAFRA